jgi:hypothetical protein
MNLIEPSNPASMQLRPAAGAGAAPGAATAAAAPAAIAARADFSNVQAGAPVPVLRPGDTNTFTGSNGVTRAIAPASAAAAAPAATQPRLQQPAQVLARPSNAAAVRESTQAAVAGQRDLARTARADAAQFLNPMSDGAEIMRRFENSQNSYFNKGSPQARRMQGEAILGQLGAQNRASDTGQQAGSAVLQQGAGQEGTANEAYAQRRLAADTFNADDGYRRDQLAAEQQRPTGQSVRGTDGRTSVLRNDGNAFTLRDEAGNPVQTQDPNALTPSSLLAAYTDQAAAVAEGLGSPDDKNRQMAALRADPIYSPLFQGGAGAGQAPAQPGAPALVGYRAGKPIYRDASGNLFIDEGN